MGILDSLKNDAQKVETKVEETLNPAPAAPKEEAPAEQITPEVAPQPTVETTKCTNCVDGLVGDPAALDNKVCTVCNGTGQRVL